MIWRLSSSVGFLPLGLCYPCTLALLGLHAVSDILIAFAYFFGLAMLVHFMRKRRERRFRGMFLCFGGFIAAFGTTLVIDAMNLPVPSYRLSAGLRAITATAPAATALFLVYLIPTMLEELRTTKEELNRETAARSRAEEAVGRLAGRLLHSQDDERRKIAQELHDSTGQSLVALAAMITQLRASIPSKEHRAKRVLSECIALADRCHCEVRTLSYELYPPELDEPGLEGAIRCYIKGFGQRSGVRVELEVASPLERLTPEVELVLFRVVQEGLTNIHRHSGGSQAKICIRRDDQLTLEISDRGKDLQRGGHEGREELPMQFGVGIPTMRERVRLIGGLLEFDFNDKGSIVRVTLPLSGKRPEKLAHSDSSI
jgi:signal transduction histidine kinase